MMSTKITQQNINNVSDCLMKNCHNFTHDFSQHLGHNSEWSYLFDICNKKGKVICYPHNVEEIEETLKANGFEINSQVSECPTNTNFKMFLFREKKEEEETTTTSNIDPEIKAYLEKCNVEILKVDKTGYIELRPTRYLYTDKTTAYMYKNRYERTRREWDDGLTTLGFTPITIPAERLFNKIDNDVIENFEGWINYVEIEDYNDNVLKISYSTTGGYERDVNAYWGGEEYVEDLVGTLECYPEINKISYDLDEEDLTGYITIEYDINKVE